MILNCIEVDRIIVNGQFPCMDQNLVDFGVDKHYLESCYTSNIDWAFTSFSCVAMENLVFHKAGHIEIRKK